MKSKYDPLFLISISILIIFGLFVLTSASLSLSTDRFGQPYYYLFHQIVFGIFPGTIFLLFAYKFYYRKWRALSLPIIIGAALLMLFVFIPQIGFFHGGARRWLSFGPFSFQPSEFLKFAFVLYLASWLERRSKNLHSFKMGLLPFSIMSAFAASFLILQPDIGTLLVLLMVVFSMFFISGGKLRQIALLFFISFIVLGILIFIEPYRFSRLMVFMNPSYDTSGAGYQLNQGLIAIGSGGIFGKGFGMSLQKTGFVPEVIGDSIFAIIGEELGLIGGIFFVFLILFIFFRGTHIVNKTPDYFGKLLGMGILFTIIFQSFINMAAIVGLIPLTGIPLSLVSYGGSALAIMMGEIGIILNISKYTT